MTRIEKGLLLSGEVNLGSLLPISNDNDQKQGNLAGIGTQNWQAYSMNGCSSGMRNLRTLFDLASDWLMAKWSVLIGREKISRD